jgi:hypothetical protein
MLVSTGAIVNGTYSTSRSGRRIASPRRAAINAPAANRIKYATVATVARR